MQGNQGYTGYTGAVGPTGNSGLRGFTGPTGPASLQAAYDGGKSIEEDGTTGITIQETDAGAQALLTLKDSAAAAGTYTGDLLALYNQAGTKIAYFDNSGELMIDKITVATMDPPYTIEGNKYATYLPAMTGIKEETTGITTTSQYISGKGYQAVLDFGNSPSGSDLWLFSKTTNLRNNLDRLVALLSPQANVKTWYNIDKSQYKLYIYASQPTTVSYRLTAPRFDSERWSNYRTNDVVGLVVPSDIPTSPEEETVFTLPTLEDFQITASNIGYKLTDSGGQAIHELGFFSEAAIATLKAGLIQTDRLEVNTKIITPLIESRDIVSTGSAVFNNLEANTATISTLTANVIEASSSAFGKLLVDKDATVDGTLRVNRLEANEIVGLKASFADVTNITNVTRITEITKIIEQLATPSATPTITPTETPTPTPSPTPIEQTPTPTASPTPTEPESTPSASLIDRLYDLINTPESSIAAQLSDLPPGVVDLSINLMDSIAQRPLTVGQSYTDIGNINAKEGIFRDSLTALGTTSLGQTTIAGDFLQDGNLRLANGNEIETIMGTLFIQKLAQGGVDFLNSKVTIAQNGDVNITQNLTVGGQLATNNISTIGQANLTINLSDNLLINNSAGETIAAITSDGNATFSGELTASTLTSVNGLNITEVSAATESGTTTAIEAGSASIGKATIGALNTYVIINTTKVTEKSLIYITPTSSTGGQVPFVSEIIADTSFKVELDHPINTDVKFNWWIVN